MFNWQAFVVQWSEALLQTSDIAQDLPPEVVASGVASGWIGNQSATEEQIARLEAHLGTGLPSSYRAFLRTSNGWQWDGIPLWSTEEIEWLSVRNQQFIDDVIDVVEDISATLQISDWADTDIYLLNPRVKTEDGEWEAWHYASYRPGFAHYRSFHEMMQVAYEKFVRLNS